MINPFEVYQGILANDQNRLLKNRDSEMREQQLADQREAQQVGVLMKVAQMKQEQQGVLMKDALAREEMSLRGNLQGRQLESQERQATSRNTLQRDALAERSKLGATAPRNLQLTTDAEGNQLIVNPDGTARALTGPDGQPVRGAKADKPLNEFQGKSTLYGTRAAQSDKILKTLEENISTAGLATKQAVSRTPVIGGLLGAGGNLLLSTEQQRVEQAQRDFVNAVLRQESGAVISDAEFANAQKQYFPQPGDEKPTRDQKRANRALAIQGFARMAAGGSDDINAIRNSPLLPSGNMPPPPPGFVVNK